MAAPSKSLETKEEKQFAHVVQIHSPPDMIGSKQSVTSDHATIEIIPSIGVKITSKKSAQEYLIPWANIKGVGLTKKAKSKLLNIPSH